MSTVHRTAEWPKSAWIRDPLPKLDHLVAAFMSIAFEATFPILPSSSPLATTFLMGNFGQLSLTWASALFNSRGLAIAKTTVDANKINIQAAAIPRLITLFFVISILFSHFSPKRYRKSARLRPRNQ